MERLVAARGAVTGRRRFALAGALSLLALRGFAAAADASFRDRLVQAERLPGGRPQMGL
jgi:hypothetical protein